MPGKPFQSKLEPFHEFIREGRAKRWSYKKIAETLTREKGLPISANAVFSYVKVRAKKRRLYALPLLETSPFSTVADQAGGFFNTTKPTYENKRKFNIT